MPFHPTRTKEKKALPKSSKGIRKAGKTAKKVAATAVSKGKKTRRKTSRRRS